MQPAWSSGAVQGHDHATYDIPEQSLALALETFAGVSAREVLYDGRLTDGRRSSLVQGRYPAEIALQILLAGSGLKAEAKDERFFVLSPAIIETDRGTVRGPETASYYAALQAGLRSTLCGAQVVFDDSRIAARLWLSEGGTVLQVKLLGSSQSSETSERTTAALRKLQVGRPPQGFAQPVTIVVRPRTANDDGGCAAPLRPSRAAP